VNGIHEWGNNRRAQRYGLWLLLTVDWLIQTHY
jgi:hypothetical protein